MFIVEPFTVRWGNPDHTAYLAHIKQENDPDFFECIISKNDPCQEFADIYEKIVNGDYGDIGAYQEPEPMPVAPVVSVVYGPDEAIVGGDLPETETVDLVTQTPVLRFELWRVKRALRDIPATSSFKAYISYSGIVVNDEEGREITVDNLSGLDQVSFAIRSTNNVSLKDFWRDGIYVYDSSPNYKAFASILELTPQQVIELQNRVTSYVV